MTVLAGTVVLAAGAGSYAGPLGLVVVLLLAVATIFLVRNMDKRLRKLPRTFDEPGPGVAPPLDAPPADREDGGHKRP